MTGKVAQIVLAAGVHVYRPFSDAELNHYLEFALSPVGNKYFIAIGDALIEVLKQSGGDNGQDRIRCCQAASLSLRVKE